MQFYGEELFVGALAMAIGSAGLYGSLAERAWLFRLNKVRWLEERLGRSAARWLCACLAVGLIVLGGAIAMGFSIQSTSSRDERLPEERSPKSRATGERRVTALQFP